MYTLMFSLLGNTQTSSVSFKSLLGFKKPSTADLSPENTPPPPQFPTKDRVAEFAAEIGKYFKELLYVFQTVYLLFFCFPFSFQLKKYASEFWKNCVCIHVHTQFFQNSLVCACVCKTNNKNNK